MLKFIDLFAGLGGFHLALEQLGHECVFASEINKPLAELYTKNYNLEPFGDIRKIDIETEVPLHDILCGGFPCQPFSIAGKKSGKEHDSGNLFDKIVEILEIKKPKFFILENVPHIKQLEDGAMWRYIEDNFRRLGYDFRDKIYSPHQFGIPQHRKRIYIVGCLGVDSLADFKWLEPTHKQTTINDILDDNPIDAIRISKERLKCLEVWQNFIDAIPKQTLMPQFPIWAAEFGANYPIEDGKTPPLLSDNELEKFKGSFGQPLKGLSIKSMPKEMRLKYLPTYVFNTDKNGNYPDWKKRYITQNREFYDKHQNDFKDVIKEIAVLNIPSWQKLEWNVKEEGRIIKNYIIQFRQSGVRIKKTETSPALVCTSTEIPIIGWQDRYITKAEGARLQSISNIELPDVYSTSFKALGNAVNVEIVKQIAENLLSFQLTSI